MFACPRPFAPTAALVAVWLCAAGAAPVAAADNGPATGTRKAAGQRPKTATRPAAPALPTRLVRLTIDSLAGQPFGPEPTVQELVQHGAVVVAKRPFRNLHEANQVDTLLLLRHQGNTFEFYRAPDRDLLRDATITNFRPAYAQRLRRRLEAAHRPAPGTIERVRIGDTERANFVSVVFQSGRLSAVRVEPYVD